MRRNLFGRKFLTLSMGVLLLVAFFMPVHAQPSGDAKTAGHQSLERGDFAQAYRHWRSLAEAGDVELQLQLGMLFWNGFGAESSDPAGGPAPDPQLRIDQARYWFGRAATSGSGAGHHMAGLAWCCWPDRSGTPAPGDDDWRRATAHFEQAAALGSGGAQLVLGELLARGAGPIRRDRKLAIRYLRDAQANDSAPVELRQRAAALATRLETRDRQEERLRTATRDAIERGRPGNSAADAQGLDQALKQ